MESQVSRYELRTFCIGQLVQLSFFLIGRHIGIIEHALDASVNF